jgi:type IX secretion system PorP/SprF family membrane protein
MRKVSQILLLCIVLADLSAQDPIFSQFYAMPLQINPAFAGSAFAPRMGIAYRNQWTGFNSAYRTYAAFYEQRFERLNSGIGFNLEGDNAGDGIYKTTKFSTNFAYRLTITDELGVKFGVEAGMHQVNLDWDKLVFGDQLDAVDGISFQSEEIRPDATNVSRLDISAGMMLLSSKFYVGGAVKHLNTPNEGILLINDNLSRGLPMRYTVHGGSEIIVKRGNKRQAPSFISPNFLFLAQGPYKQLNVGAYAGLRQFYAGAWHRTTFRNADAVILLAGFRDGVFKVGISYDFTVSGLSANAGSTFEVTMGVLLDNSERLRKKKKRADINDCLRMFQ